MWYGIIPVANNIDSLAHVFMSLLSFQVCLEIFKSEFYL